jgi:hypothetical protein
LFIEPIRNLVSTAFGVPASRSASPPGVLEQDLAVAGDEHGTGELVGLGKLAGALRNRLQRLCLGHAVCRQRDRKLDRRSGAHRLKPNVVHTG